MIGMGEDHNAAGGEPLPSQLFGSAARKGRDRFLELKNPFHTYRKEAANFVKKL